MEHNKKICNRCGKYEVNLYALVQSIKVPSFFVQQITALETLHKTKYIHGNIAPDKFARGYYNIPEAGKEKDKEKSYNDTYYLFGKYSTIKTKWIASWIFNAFIVFTDFSSATEIQVGGGAATENEKEAAEKPEGKEEKPAEKDEKSADKEKSQKQEKKKGDRPSAKGGNYAPLSVEKSTARSRCDDMESLGYVIFHLAAKKGLPWEKSLWATLFKSIRKSRKEKFWEETNIDVRNLRFTKLAEWFWKSCSFIVSIRKIWRKWVCIWRRTWRRKRTR